MAFNRIAGLFLAFFYIAGLLAPNHYFPWGAYYNEMPAGVALAIIGIWCLWSIKRTDFLLPRYLVFLMALPLIPVIQWCFGLIHFAGDAWVAGLYLGGAVVAVCCGFLLANSKECGADVLIRWMAWIMLIGAVLSAFIALRQAFGSSGALWEMEIPRGGRPVANLAQPNQLATLLLLGFISLVHLHGLSGVGRICFAALAFVLGLGLAAVQSRSSLLVELALILWLLLRFPGGAAERRKVRAAALCALGVFLLIWFCWPFMYGAWQVNDSAETRGLHDAARWVIWRQMFDAISLSPWLGYGWGQVSFAQFAVVANFPSAMVTESAHNLFFDLLIWTGLPIGTAIIFSILVWGVGRVRKEHTVVSWYALGVIGTVLIHAMLEFPLHYAYFLFPVAMMVGVVDAEFGRKCIKNCKWFFGGMALSTLALFSLMIFEYPSAEEGIRKLRFESMGIAQNDGVGSKELGKKLFLLSQMRGFLEFAIQPAHEGMSNDELEQMKVASRRFPYPPSIFRYAFALALNGYPELAVGEMNILRSLHGEKHYLEARSNLLLLSDRYPQLLTLSGGVE